MKSEINVAQKPIAWTIAGSDSGGGAGIQADLHTFQDLGVHGCTAITAITAQNSHQVNQVTYTSNAMLLAQLETLTQDLPAKALKLGMLGTESVIETVATWLADYPGYVVCDPVMVSSSGAELLQQNARQQYRKQILPLAHIVTPNLREAELLINRPIRNTQDIKDAAKFLLEMGCNHVLIKGGHGNSNLAQDYYTDGQSSFWLNGKRHNHSNTHGTGCTLSAAITACLALGYTIADALVIAKAYISQGIRLAQPYGRGPGPVAHLGWPAAQQDLPWITEEPNENSLTFPNCGPEPLGFYPIVDNSQHLQELLAAGATTIQLRMKNKPRATMEKEIQHSTQLTQPHQARLFINDYWELAIKYGAYGVHLGQEDLASANIPAIHKAGLRLGISTHSSYEIARAHAHRPSYIAFGPIFATQSKPMNFPPQGIDKLAYWVQTLSYPVVAIGGINKHNLAQIQATHCSGYAVIKGLFVEGVPL